MSVYAYTMQNGIGQFAKLFLGGTLGWSSHAITGKNDSFLPSQSNKEPLEVTRMLLF